MSDYTPTTDFSVKDNLAPGDSEKLIIGSDLDTELDAIAVAVATKYDSGDLASQAQAEAETLNTVLITPLRLANWSDQNGGLVGEIIELADPAADGLLGWDDSASADANVIFFTPGTGLAISGTEIILSFLGLEALVDPDADQGVMWDDSAGAMAFAGAGLGLSYDATPDLNVDIANATELAVTPSYNDEVLISDGGVIKRIDVATFQNLRQSTTEADDYTAVIGDQGGLVQMSKGTATTFTIPLHAAVAFTDDAIIVVRQIGAGTVTIAHAGTITSPGSLLTLGQQYDQVVCHRTAEDVWHCTGGLG